MVARLISLSSKEASARYCGPVCVALQLTVPSAPLMAEISAGVRGVFRAFSLSISTSSSHLVEYFSWFKIDNAQVIHLADVASGELKIILLPFAPSEGFG